MIEISNNGHKIMKYGIKNDEMKKSCGGGDGFLIKYSEI